jgi:hypothetical protein
MATRPVHALLITTSVLGLAALAAACGSDDGTPAAPTELKAEPASPAPAVHLTWKDNASNEIGFDVERKTGTGAFEIIRAGIPFDPNQNVNQYHDGKVMAPASYAFRVAAIGQDGKRSYSAEVTIALR